MNRKISKVTLLSIFFVGMLLIVTGILYSSFSLVDPVKSISFTSENLNYEKKTPGAWKVEKSAKWVSQGKARITFDVDTISKAKYQNTDVILVMDISVSMSGYKIEKAKENALGLVDQVLSTSGNKMSLIKFNDSAEIMTGFINDKEELKSSINSLSFNKRSSYYQAFVKVEELLKEYQKEENRDCVVLFLTGSYPSSDTPNEVGYFNYLKEEYPYVTINAVQYGMSEDVLEPVRQVSDNQYVVNSETKENVLLEAYQAAEEYSKFILTDYIDANNFNLKSSSDITVSQGNITFNQEEQKVIWTIDNLKSGSKVRMDLDVNLSNDFINKADVYTTNTQEEVESSIDGVEEKITSNKTPRISNNYRVSYDGNAPSGCSVSNIPESENHFVFDKVSISENIPECEGYIFQEWKVVGVEAKQINSDFFIMPEADVILKAEWRKLSLAKSMDGEIYIAPVPKMQVALNPDTGAEEIWKYKDSVTKVVFQDQIKEVYNTLESFDLSEENNYGVMGRVVPNQDDTSTYTVYIQGDNGVIANKNSSYLFNQFRRLESIEGLEYLDTTNVTDMSYMFGWCESLKSLDLRTFDTSKVTTMLNMFRDNLALTNLDVSSFDTSNVTTMQWMFGGTGSLKALNLSNFNTPKVTDMTAMFAGTGITSLDLSNFDTRNVTTMRVMFNNANYLETLNVSGWNTEKVTNMANLFGYCRALKSLDLSSFRTSNVTTIANIFVECKELETLDLSNWSNPKITTMASMFKDCSKLVSLNLTNFYTNNVTDMGNMFNNCVSLTTLDVGSFNTSKVTNMSGMFDVCNSLISLDLSNFDTSNVTKMNNMFENCRNLTSLNISNFDTSKVTNMGYMFEDCNKLTILDVSNFNTSRVTDMSRMFSECYSLTSLDVSKFNTSSVKNMEGTFNNCRGLTILDVSKFVISQVTNMQNMFAYCSGLTSLDVSNFNTSNVTNMSRMFLNCKSLTSLNLNSFSTSNVTNMANVFSNCTGLKSINIDNFDTSKVTDMTYMFNYCTSLENLDITNFNTLNVTNMRCMFQACNTLKSLDLSNFNTSKVTDMGYMFSGNYYLGTLDVSSFNTQNVTNMSHMFYDCQRLTDLNLSGFDTSKVTDVDYMFFQCTHLTTTLTIKFTSGNYASMFETAAVYSGQITLNYTSISSSWVDTLLTTKSSNGNVVKGSLIG